jgi:hypothetical protein
MLFLQLILAGIVAPAEEQLTDRRRRQVSIIISCVRSQGVSPGT